MSSIGSTIHSINTSLLSGIQSLSAAKAASKSAKASPPVANADRADFSKAGKLFSELEQLQKSDPEGLKQVLTDAASKLKEAATQETDVKVASVKVASFLNDLAGRFEKAANTGDLTALHPEASLGTSGPRGHHGNPHPVQRADHDSDEQPSNTTSKPPPRLLGPPVALPPAPLEESKAEKESTENQAITVEPTQPAREERFLSSVEVPTESFIASTREERSQTTTPEPVTTSPEIAQLLGPPEPAPIANAAGEYLADRYAYHEVRKADNYSEDGGGGTKTFTEPAQISRADRFLPPPDAHAESQVSSPASTLATILTSSLARISHE